MRSASGAHVPKESNIYDLVEREAARSGIPRMELWRSLANALVEKTLPASKLPVPPDWLVGFKASVDRYNDPNSGVVRILKQIVVRTKDFKKWRQRGLAPGKRGPRQNTTGYQASDRKLFPCMRKLIKNGDARSPYSAALLLANDIRGRNSSPESKAKRVSKLYRRENPDTR
jgi:hypothetical protein